MKERPINLRQHEVVAIRAGRQTQLRRVVKLNAAGRVAIGGRQWHIDDPNAVLACPYGQPGDRLWGREPHWRFTGCAQGGKPWPGFVQSPNGDPYNARCYDDYAEIGALRLACAGFRMSAVQMPRWASRIALDIARVRVERVQGISEEDAKAEGFKAMTKDGSLFKWGIPDRDGFPGTDDDGWPWADWHADPRVAYRRLFESIHGPGSWDANPFVWVLEFRGLT